MSLPRSHEQEELSLTYIRTLASRAGVQCSETGKTEYGIDLHLNVVEHRPGIGNFPLTPTISVQVKATQNWEEKNGHIIYDLEAEGYQKLYHSVNSRLFLFCLPQEYREWVDISPERLIIRKCCYWYRVVEPSTNRRSQRIFIPTNQLVTDQTLRSVLNDARKEALEC